MSEINQNALRDINAMIAKMCPELCSRPARFTYWSSKNKANSSRSKDKYFYTTHKINHKGLPRYVSGVYRYNASKKQWRALMEAGHAKKKAAMARAYKLYQENR